MTEKTVEETKPTRAQRRKARKKAVHKNATPEVGKPVRTLSVSMQQTDKAGKRSKTFTQKKTRATANNEAGQKMNGKHGRVP